jgi:hypothetical protein
VSPVAPVLATDCFVVYSLRLPHRAFFRRFNLLILTSLIRFSFPHLLVIICAFSSSVHCHHLCIVIICALSSSVQVHFPREPSRALPLQLRQNKRSQS